MPFSTRFSAWAVRALLDFLGPSGRSGMVLSIPLAATSSGALGGFEDAAGCGSWVRWHSMGGGGLKRGVAVSPQLCVSACVCVVGSAWVGVSRAGERFSGVDLV